MKTITVSVSDFKSRALGLFEEVSHGDKMIIVTKRGHPLARVLCETPQKKMAVPGTLAETLVTIGDVTTPFGEKLWNATQDDTPWEPS